MRDRGIDNLVYLYLHLARGGKLYLIRDRDGIPLAKGYNRAQLERTGEVFRSLGVPCRVVRAHTGGYGKGYRVLCQEEDESRAEFLRRDRAARAAAMAVARAAARAAE